MSSCLVSRLQSRGAAAVPLVIGGLLLGGVCGLADADATLGKPYPTAVGIGLSEFRISIYKPRVYAGRLQLNAKNYGEDDHNISVLRPDGKAVRQVPTLTPSGTTSARLTINTPGRYKLVCTLADHASRGMVATLTVRKPRKR